MRKKWPLHADADLSFGDRFPFSLSLSLSSSSPSCSFTLLFFFERCREGDGELNSPLFSSSYGRDTVLRVRPESRRMPNIRSGNERKRKNMFEPRAKVSSDLVSDEQLNKAGGVNMWRHSDTTGARRRTALACYPVDNSADRVDCRYPVPISRESFRFFSKLSYEKIRIFSIINNACNVNTIITYRGLRKKLLTWPIKISPTQVFTYLS